jgi:hypothetical protein
VWTRNDLQLVRAESRDGKLQLDFPFIYEEFRIHTKDPFFTTVRLTSFGTVRTPVSTEVYRRNWLAAI